MQRTSRAAPRAGKFILFWLKKMVSTAQAVQGSGKNGA